MKFVDKLQDLFRVLFIEPVAIGAEDRDERGSARGLPTGAAAMIKVKHFLDPVEKDDGQRIWVEPCGLVKDLRTWCKVDHVLPHLGPPKALADWLEEHPDGYEYFRARYHECLERSPYKP